MFLQAFLIAAASGMFLGIAGFMIAGASIESAAIITGASAGPAVLLSAIAAGQMARVGAKANPPWRVGRWMRRGAGVGAIVGGVSLTLPLFAMSLSGGGPPAEAVEVTFVTGAIAGCALGALVGWRCARLASSHA